jgi:hypothetical protein
VNSKTPGSDFFDLLRFFCVIFGCGWIIYLLAIGIIGAVSHTVKAGLQVGGVIP